MQPRTKNLSTRFLPLFKAIVLALYTGFVVFLLYMTLFQSAVFLGLSYIYLMYLLLQILLKIKHVEYDENFLYVRHKGIEVLIPLENIKNVEIKTLGGVYRVDLYDKDLVGEYFYFKPSLLYPLNHRSKDRAVDEFGRAIDRAKKRPQEAMPKNALMS